MTTRTRLFARACFFVTHIQTRRKNTHKHTAPPNPHVPPSYTPPSYTDGNPARVSVCMARRRQSVNNRVESDLAQFKQPIAEQHNRSGTPHCELNEVNSPIFVPSTRNWSDHTQPLDIQGTSTAISIPPASSSTDEEPRDVPTSLPKKTGKVSPPPFARGWLGKGAAKASLPSNKDARTSKRSDSVALSQAEGGSFLPDMNGIDVSRSGPHAPRLYSRLSIASLARSLNSRRVLLPVLFGLVCFGLLLGPASNRETVLLKANHALDQSLTHAEKYWGKADDLWSGMRYKEVFETTETPPSNTPFGSYGAGGKHDDQSTHGKVGAHGKIGSGTHGEASILDAVRIMPAVHQDKLKTTRCTVPSADAVDAKGQQRPLIQYAIMIDAGSTGSRVHVYRFNFCKASPELEEETFKMIIGGLSSFRSDAQGAALSLKPLLQTAMDAVPESLWSCTPISIKATAGLRLLGPEMSRGILAAVRSMLETQYPFPIADSATQNGVEIMEGREEGVFAWITVNYLLNRIATDQDATPGSNPRTAAVMDLGGASTQIVFEPVYASPTQGMHPGEHVYELSNFGGRKYTLYQNSYLGYGLMEARKSINSLSYFTYALSHPDMVRTGVLPTDSVHGADVRVPSPCFAEGQSKQVSVHVTGTPDDRNVTMFGTAGGYEACKRLVEVMMDKDAVCTQPPCSFAGVYQPSLMTAFAQSPIVALSYFYDRLSPLGLDGTFTLDNLVELSKKVCVPPAQWPTHFDAQRDPKMRQALSELRSRPESCLDLTFLTTLLRLGYELHDSRSITVAKKLAGNELGWCLGAQLQVLQDAVVCKKA